MLETSARKRCQPVAGGAEKRLIAVPDGPDTLTTAWTLATPVSLGRDQFNCKTALPAAGVVALAFATA